MEDSKKAELYNKFQEAHRLDQRLDQNQKFDFNFGMDSLPTSFNLSLNSLGSVVTVSITSSVLSQKPEVSFVSYPSGQVVVTEPPVAPVPVAAGTDSWVIKVLVISNSLFAWSKHLTFQVQTA